MNDEAISADDFASKLSGEIQEDLSETLEQDDLEAENAPVEDAGDVDADAAESAVEDDAQEDGEQDDEPEDPYAAFLDDDEVPTPRDEGEMNLEVEQQLNKDKDGEIAALNEKITSLQKQVAMSAGPQEPNVDLLDPESEAYDPDLYYREKAAFERHQKVTNAAMEQVNAQRAQEVQRFAVTREKELRKSNPELFHPERGPKLAQAVANLAAEAGVDQEQMPFIPAKGVAMILDAIKFRSGQKALAKAKTAKTDSKTARRSMRAAPKQGQKARDALNQTGSKDAFATLMSQIE